MEAERVIEHTVNSRSGVFKLTVGGQELGELHWRRRGPGKVDANHTLVHPAARGQGIARSLVDALAAWARDEKTKVIPSCWYVQEVFDTDPAFDDVVA